MVEAAESALPLNMSPKCSVVDFSESGYITNDDKVSGVGTNTTNAASRLTFKAAAALSVKDCLPASDMM